MIGLLQKLITVGHKLCRKKGAQNFERLVVECLDSVKMHHRYSFSSRARQYMLAYDTLARWELTGNEELVPEMTAHLLDQVVKQRKSHHTVGHDGKWVNMITSAITHREVHDF